MRIIGGRHGGRSLKVPAGLPVRPTTDFAKEGLFNVLGNLVDFEGLSVLDLFSGTGHISLEFASRGAKSVTAVDVHARCVAFLRDISGQLDMDVATVKEDVFRFLKQTTTGYDLVFADPPYDLPNIPDIHNLACSGEVLNPGGLLVIEHGPQTSLAHLPHFMRERKYGNVRFSFFRPSDGLK